MSTNVQHGWVIHHLSGGEKKVFLFYIQPLEREFTVSLMLSKEEKKMFYNMIPEEMMMKRSRKGQRKSQKNGGGGGGLSLQWHTQACYLLY